MSSSIFWEEEAFLHRDYSVTLSRERLRMLPEIQIQRGGIQFNAAASNVTGAAITAPTGWQRPIIYPTLKEAKQFVSNFEEAYPTFLGWAIRRNARETKVQNDQDLLTQAEELRDQAAKLERIVAEREKYGADPFKNGTVLKVAMRYRTGSRRSFDYAIVKVAGKFYLSGKLVHANDSSGMDWAAFVAWLSQGDASVWQAKNLQQVF